MNPRHTHYFNWPVRLGPATVPPHMFVDFASPYFIDEAELQRMRDTLGAGKTIIVRCREREDWDAFGPGLLAQL